MIQIQAVKYTLQWYWQWHYKTVNVSLLLPDFLLYFISNISAVSFSINLDIALHIVWAS